MKYEYLKSLYYKDKAEYERIYQKRFNSDCVFHLNIDINDNPAFFLMTPELYEKIFKMSQMDCALNILCEKLPAVAIGQYIRKSLIGEIVGTNDIEHIHTSRKEIGEALNAVEHKAKGNRFKDITNRYNLLGQEEYEIRSCKDIRKIYDDLLSEEIREENPDDLPDGKYFRKSSVDVRTGTDKVVHTGILPEKKIIEYMNKALVFLNFDDINIFFRIAVFHYLFGYIHPFYDGNGRMSRFISSTLLYKIFFSPLPAYRLSGTLNNNKNRYYKAFEICNDPKNKGDLTPFVDMFLDIIFEAVDFLGQSLYEKKERLDYFGEHMEFLPDSSSKHAFDIYFLLIQASLFSENGICKEEMCGTLNISRGALDNIFRKISKDFIYVCTLGKTKYYKLNLKKFEELIKDHK